MEIEHSYKRKIPVFTLAGRFDGTGASQFDSFVAEQNLTGNTWILDLFAVNYLSSAGIRSLLKIEQQLRSKSGRAILVGIAPFVRQVIETAGLLDHFSTCASLEDALAVAQPASDVRTLGLQGRVYRITGLDGGRSWLELWGPPGLTVSNQIAAETLLRVSLQDLGFCFGIAGFGNNKEQATETIGICVALETVAALQPSQTGAVCDFVVSPDPAVSTIFVASAVGLTGAPDTHISIRTKEHYTVRALMRDIVDIMPGSSPVGFILLCNGPEEDTSHAESVSGLLTTAPMRKLRKQSGGMVLTGLVLRDAPEAPEIQERIALFNDEPFICFAITLSSRCNPTTPEQEPRQAIRNAATIQDLENLAVLKADTVLGSASGWLYRPTSIRVGMDKLLKIEVEAEEPLREEWDSIVRRIYADCRTVILNPLHGGFMAKTFRVTSFDVAGRKQLPTVLKLGPTEVIAREETACKNYVEKFILNNSTTILGRASEGDWAGVRYNFLGIHGPETRLMWFRDLYVSRPMEELQPIIESIFGRILQPWYGQPRKEDVYLFKEHTPLRIFSTVFEDAEKDLNINADHPTIAAPEMGREVPNPLYFLRHGFPKRENRSMPWYSTICHGDLNMQNVLLDEQKNVYIIDFSETGPRNAVTDFARWETIVKFEMARLEDEKDLLSILEFEKAICSSKSLSESPPWEYIGDDPAVAKAHAVIRLMRSYAAKTVYPETNILPYWMAVLEWTIAPIAYRGFPILRKRYAALSAALIVERILELEQTDGN